MLNRDQAQPRRQISDTAEQHRLPAGYGRAYAVTGEDDPPTSSPRVAGAVLLFGVVSWGPAPPGWRS